MDREVRVAPVFQVRAAQQIFKPGVVHLNTARRPSSWGGVLKVAGFRANDRTVRLNATLHGRQMLIRGNRSDAAARRRYRQSDHVDEASRDLGQNEDLSIFRACSTIVDCPSVGPVSFNVFQQP